MIILTSELGMRGVDWQRHDAVLGDFLPLLSTEGGVQAAVRVERTITPDVLRTRMDRMQAELARDPSNQELAIRLRQNERVLEGLTNGNRNRYDGTSVKHADSSLIKTQMSEIFGRSDMMITKWLEFFREREARAPPELRDNESLMLKIAETLTRGGEDLAYELQHGSYKGKTLSLNRDQMEALLSNHLNTIAEDRISSLSRTPQFTEQKLVFDKVRDLEVILLEFGTRISS